MNDERVWGAMFATEMKANYATISLCTQVYKLKFFDNDDRIDSVYLRLVSFIHGWMLT